MGNNEDDWVGRALYSADGHYLGNVARLESGWLRVDAPQTMDYWLPDRLVRAVVNDQVLLREDAATVERIKRYELPAHAEQRSEREQEQRLYEFGETAGDDNPEQGEDAGES